MLLMLRMLRSTVQKSGYPEYNGQERPGKHGASLFSNKKNLQLSAPTGALIVIMVYYISAAAAAATFSDFQSVH